MLKMTSVHDFEILYVHCFFKILYRAQCISVFTFGNLERFFFKKCTSPFFLLPSPQDKIDRYRVIHPWCSLFLILFGIAMMKKKTKFSTYIRKSRRERLQSHIWLTASWYMTKILRISHILLCNRSHLNFLIFGENFISFLSLWDLYILMTS